MFGMNIKQEGIEVLGDQLAFNKYTHFWRRALEVLHDAHCGPLKADEQPETDEDHIVGRYVYITAPIWDAAKSSMSKAEKENRILCSVTLLAQTVVSTMVS